MATDKRPVHSVLPAHKEHGHSSLAIQLPTSSAISGQDINNNNNNTVTTNSRPHRTIDFNAGHRHNAQANPRYPLNSGHRSESNQEQHLLNYCHHEAATRSLLYHRHHSSDLLATTETPATRTESEESATPPPHYHEIPGIVPAYQGRTSGPPPAYDDVVNPNASPPSYNSLYGQVREARKTSNGLVDLLRQLFLILIGTIGCTMIIGFLLLIPITMILIGLFYVNECRAENIPSFLVIGGFVWIIKNVLNCYNHFKKDSSSSNRPPPRRRSPISATSSTGSTTIASTSTNTSTINNGHVGVSRNGSTVSGGASSSLSTSSYSSTSQQLSTRSHNLASSSVLIAPCQIQLTNHETMAGLHHNQDQSNAGSEAMNASHRDEFINRHSDLSSEGLVSISSQATSASASTSITSTSSAIAGPPLAPTTRPRSVRDQANSNHIRHPPMIGLTSYKCESILNYFLIVWFLAGCIVVYRIYEPDYENHLSASYCNRTVYLYAFWLMTSAFIIMAVVLSCLCCLMASSLMSCNHGR